MYNHWFKEVFGKISNSLVPFPEILIDQGLADSFLEEGLRPWLLEEACKNTDINLKLRMQPHYDHSYYFVSTFMADHLEWHKERI